MFENTNTTREQGDIGMTAALFYLSKMGYIPLLPITDNNIYDLVIDIDNIFKSVQVKTSRYKNQAGNYEVQLKRVRPNRTENVIHAFDKTEVDYLFILVESGDQYFIPCNELYVTSTITLGLKYEKYKL